MASNTQKAQEIHELASHYQGQGERTKALKNGKESNDFYFGHQWTKDGRNEMIALGLYPAIVNKIKIPADHLISIYAGTHPRGRVTFNSGRDDKAAFMINGILKWIFYLSDYERQNEEVSRDIIHRGGLGWKMPVVSKNSSDGLGDIKIMHVPHEFVLFSKTIRQIPSLDDAPDVIIKKPETIYEAIRKHPGKKSKILDAAGAYEEAIRSDNVGTRDETLPKGPIVDTDGTKEENKTVWKIEKYEIVKRTRFKIRNKVTGNLIYTYESNMSVLEQFTDFLDLTTREEVESVMRCKVTHTYAPNIFIGEEWFEMDRYPMVPYIGTSTGNLFPRDVVYFVKDEQRILNKSVSQGIQHTQSANTPKIFIGKHSRPEDIDEIQRKYLQPGAIIEVEVDPLSGELPIKVIPPVSLTNPYYATIPMQTQAILDGMGVSAQDLGEMRGLPETYNATALVSEAGRQKLRTSLNSYGLSEQRLLDNVVQLIPEVYNEERVISFLDDEFEEEFQEIVINQATEKSHWKKICATIMDGEEVTTGAIGDLRPRFRIIKDSFAPTDRMAHRNMLLEALKLTSGNMEIFSEIIKLTDLPNRKRISDKLSMVQKLAGQNEQLKKQLQDSIITRDRAQREEVNAKQSAMMAEFKAKYAIQFIKNKEKQETDIIEFEADLDKALTEFEANLKVELEKHKSKMRERENG